MSSFMARSILAGKGEKLKGFVTAREHLLNNTLLKKYEKKKRRKERDSDYAPGRKKKQTLGTFLNKKVKRTLKNLDVRDIDTEVINAAGVASSERARKAIANRKSKYNDEQYFAKLESNINKGRRNGLAPKLVKPKQIVYGPKPDPTAGTTVKALRALCKQMGLKNYSKMKKQQLMELLTNHKSRNWL